MILLGHSGVGRGAPFPGPTPFTQLLQGTHMADPKKKTTQKDSKIDQKLNAIQGIKKVKTDKSLEDRRRNQSTDSNN